MDPTIWDHRTHCLDFYGQIETNVPCSTCVPERGDEDWPARSPDLGNRDFFLWGYLKKTVFKHRPHILEELKTRIIEKTSAMLFECAEKQPTTLEIDYISKLLLKVAILLKWYSKLNKKKNGLYTDHNKKALSIYGY